MRTLLCILILTGAGLAQEQKVRVSISQDGELGRLLRDELTNSNVAVVSSKRGDYQVTVALSPLAEDTGCRGVIGVLLIEGRDGKQLSVFIAASLGALARQMAERIGELRKK